VAFAIAHGWLTLHPSGGYVTAQYRQFSKFGPLSLDARLYDDGDNLRRHDHPRAVGLSHSHLW
jgi:hypothetical protein